MGWLARIALPFGLLWSAAGATGLYYENIFASVARNADDIERPFDLYPA
jgi:hypothetical protein